MRWLLLARGLSGGVCLVGCATLAGINDGEDRKISDDAGTVSDQLPSRDDGSTTDDAGPGACPPGGNAADSEASIHATKVTKEVKVDGDGAEWTCVDRLAFTTGQRVVGLAANRGVADVAMQWDETHLYLWAKVRTASPTGNAQRLANFNNDSFHLYVASRTPTQTYTAADHHIVIDPLRQVADYEISTRPGLAGIDATSGLMQDEGGGIISFVVEAKLDAAIIGRTTFAAGDTVRVNFQINDQPDVANNYRIWFRDVAVCTTFATCERAGGSEPYCDPRCTGPVVLR